MVSHKHSFECFDAVVEKPALTTGHNFALPHSCDCTSIRLEQLENRRCSLSSESQQIKPVTSEVLENQPASWYQSQCPSHQHTPRRPMGPKGDPVYSVTRRQHNHRHHQYHTHSHRKRIILVKNSNPSIQKTILVHCRPVHSLSVFINDVSELMQCHIRNLYTLDGCKVDSVQSLLHGPSILVCVGQEPFHPFLLNIFQKNSEDKLPKLFLKTQSSTCNEDQVYKKNVNFGLKSKKDVPPGPFPETRKNMQDDVEKRVLVNKDGSLSVEMKVRFRLINDESLHCSTKIKKCTLDTSFPGQDNVYYSHCGHSESCSEAEALSASETEDICVSKLASQRNSELPHCQHCCTHCQEYDIWKCLRHIRSPSLNVASHKRKCKKESFDSVHNTSCEEYTEQVVEKATCIQHTVGEGKEGDSTVQYCTISRCSSRSEVCSVSTKTAGYTDDKDGKNKSPHAFGDRHKNLVFSKNFKQDLMSVQMTQVSTEDERPLSVETNSSDILASLKEDEDKEENELSISNSRASQSYKENDKQSCSTLVSLCSFIPCKAPESPNDLFSTRTTPKSPEAKNKPEEGVDVSYNREEGSAMSPKSNDSARSCRSRLSKVKCKERKNAELQKGESVMSVHTHASTILKQLTVSELLTNESGDQTEELMIHALSNSSRSLQISDLDLSELGEIENQRECSSSSIMSVKSNISEAIPVKFVKVHSAESTSALSTKTNISGQSMTSELSEVAPEVMDNRLLIERVQSTMSLNSNISVSSKSSNILDNNPYDSEAVEESRGGQTQGANSKKTNNLLGLNTPKISTKEADVLHEEKLKRPSSVISSKSTTSVRSTKSKLRDEKYNSTTEKTEQLQDKGISSVKPSNPMDSELSKNCKTSEDMLEESGNFEANLEEQAPQSRSTKLISPRQSEELKTGTKGKKERALSAMSSDAIKSRKCKISAQECDHPEERPASIMPNISVKSRKSIISNAPCKHEEEETKQACRRSQNALSVRSHKSRKSTGASRQDTGDKDNRERIPSVMSCKSSVSDRSIHVPNEVDNPTEDLLKQTESAYENIKDNRAASALSLKSQMSSLSIRSKDLSQERAATSMSAKSNLSTKSSTNLKNVLASHVSNTSAINSNEYLADVSPAEVEHQSTERNLSAMSGKSKVSEKSKKNFKELMNLNEEQLVERSPSAMSEKSTTKDRSKSSKAQSMENTPKSSTSAKNETLNCSIISNNSPNGDAVKSEEIWDIKESEPSDMTIKSVKSNNSSLAGIDGLMKEVTNNAEIKERASSALSNKSNISSVHHMPGSILTPASPSVSIGIAEEYDDNDEEDNSVSFLSETYIQTTDSRSKSSLTEGTIVSDTFKKSECNHKYLSQLVTDNEVANNSTAKKNSKKSSSRSLSRRSAHSDVGSSKTKYPPELTDKPINNTSLYLDIHGQKSNAIAKCKVAGKPSKSNLSNLKDRSSEKMSRPHPADFPIGSVLKQKSKEPVFSLGFCNNRSPSNENGKKWNTNKDLNICGRTCNGSLVATDPTRNISDNKSEKNSISSCRQSTSSLAQKRDNNSSELVPSILPSFSATEVVNEWLKNIPLDLYNVEDEFHLNSEEGELLAGKVTHYEEGNGSEGASGAAMLTPENEQVEDILNNESKLQKKELSSVENIQPCTFPDASSVHLMKILLRPKLERCNSLPEVSPAYGRKLSTSAKEFLDSLVHLQLLDFDTNTENGKVEKYNVLMNMLQSLWLCDHHDSVTITQRGKFNNQQTKNEEFNVQSFSETPINSSFQNSEKNSINGNTLALKSQTSTHGEGFVVLTRKQETGKTGNWIETESNSATPDIASRVQWTPENETEENIKKSDAVSSSIKNDYSLREPTETSSISNKSSGTDSNINQKLNNHEEDTHIESSEKMSPLVEDPDPVWVLNLLNNIEKQFMTYYVTAMAEFKVCWYLNNSEQLEIMLDKLKDEVHRKIQASINNELRKIQCHARRPRPPKESMSRESSNSIEQRRRRLKVNLSESIDLAATAKIIEKDKEKISADLPEGEGSVEGKSKEHAIEEIMTVEAGAVEQEEAGRESTDEKGTKVETSDNKMGEETVTNKKIFKDVSVGEETNKDNQTAEEVPATESDLEEAGKVSDDEKEKHENTHEDEINEEAEKSESTDSEEKVTFESAGKDIKNIYKESAKDDYSFKEKIDKPAENGDKTDQESAEKDNQINNELAKERETDNDELDVERNTIRTAEDEESAEYRENLYDESSDWTEIIKVKTGETVVFKMADFEKMSEAEATTDDDEVAGDDGAYNAAKSETAKDRDNEMSKIEETTHKKTVDSGTKAKTKEREETHHDKTSNEKETAGFVVEEDEEIAEAAGKNEKYDDDDESLRAKEIVDKLIVDKTADDETADDGENPNDNTTDVTADDKKPPSSDVEEIVETTGVETAENAEEQGDNRRTDGQISDDAIADDEAATETKNSEAKTGEDGDIANNGTIEGKDIVDNETTEDGEIVENETTKDGDTADNGTSKDGDTADNGTTEDGDTAENGTTEDGDTAKNGTEDGDTADNGTSKDGDIAENETTEDGDTAENGTEDGDTADNGTSEDGDTADNGTTEDGDTAENGTEDGDTADNGTSEDGDTADNGMTEDGNTADNGMTEDGDTADNVMTEDGDTADNGTSEDGNTADERETNDEELSEQEIVQNGKIDKATTEDCNKRLVTDRDGNGESNESNTDEDGFYTHNNKIKPDSEMLCVNVNTPSINSGKSAQGEAEAEEETEPIVETNGRVQGIKMPAMQPTEWSLHKTDIKMNSTVKMYPSSEDGADADSEDSDTELPNIYGRK